MLAERVRKPLNTFHSITGVLPAAMSTTMVSPTARPSPIMRAEKSPLMAVGRITETAVCHRVAPTAREAARRCSGTAARASSERV